MKLENKVVIVTGAASGFGKGIAEQMAVNGASVVVADLDGAKAQQTADAIQSNGGKAVAFEVDVSTAQQVNAMVQSAVDTYGKLDCIVNNAGIGQRPTPLEDTCDDVFEALYQINMKGVHLGCAAALKVFRQQGYGNIINTSSGIALTPRPNLVAYGASKGWVSLYTKGLAMELSGEGIRVNALCPAAGDTPMLAEFMGGTETTEGRDRFVGNIPMGRLITGDDMGAAAVFLASDDAAMITGTLLAVDGGRCI